MLQQICLYEHMVKYELKQWNSENAVSFVVTDKALKSSMHLSLTFDMHNCLHIT